jgi:hypothetical protein
MNKRERKKTATPIQQPDTYLTHSHRNDASDLESERSEEPAVLAGGVSLLKSLLDGLLSILPLCWLLESLCRNDALEGLELEGVTGRHEVVEVDDLDEWLDLGALCDALLGHVAGDLEWVTLDAGYESVAEAVALRSFILNFDDDNLLTSLSSAGDDTDTAVLEELHFLGKCDGLSLRRVVFCLT